MTQCQAQTSNDKLAKDLLPLVYQVAGQIARRVPSHIMLDDLVGAGMLGLATALTRFDPEQSETFKGYAEFRIRGEILDELRRRDTLSRDSRVEAKQIQESERKLSSDFGRKATAEEVSEHLGISLESYWSRAQRADNARTLSTEGLDFVDESMTSPFETLNGFQMREQLATAIEALPQRQRLVLWLYYFEELPLREIADLLGVSSSRICQIRSEACDRLRQTL